MRLNDKLIRKNCPSCGVEITLGASALNKKISCPKCRQTVIIANGGHETDVKPSPLKAAAKQKRSASPAPKEKFPLVQEEIRISLRRRDDAGETGEIEAPGLGEFEEHVPEQKTVVYCICNGVLKKCMDSRNCCVKAAFCVYADVPEF